MTHEPLIIFVGHYAGRTGAPISLLRIVEWFAINANHPCIVVLNNGGPLVEEYAKCATVHLWNQPCQPQRDLRNRINAVLRRSGPTEQERLSQHQTAIVSSLSTHNVGAIFNNTGVNGHILEALKSVLHVPIISRIPELEAYMRKNNENRSVDRVLALSEHFVAVSQSVKDNLVHRHAVSPERVSVVHGACATSRLVRGAGKLREKLHIPEDAFVVGGCGTMDWRKGIDLFIQVANRAVKSLDCADTYFCWIGGCVSESTCIEFHYEIELLSLSERLFFLGEVADTAPYLADLDLFLLTSREDPFPLVMLEAARQGVPIVCFEDGGGGPEFVDSTAGITVPMLDVAGMTQAVKDLKGAPELRSVLGRGAYQKSLTYTTERMGKETYDVLRTVLERWAANARTQSRAPDST